MTGRADPSRLLPVRVDFRSELHTLASGASKTFALEVPKTAALAARSGRQGQTKAQ
jgi:hypothetical protein